MTPGHRNPKAKHPPDYLTRVAAKAAKERAQVVKDEAAAEDRDAARRASELHARTIQASQDAARAASDERDAAAAEKTFFKKLREIIGF